MRSCELLSSVSINSGVAENLARDLITYAILDGEKLKPEHFPKITEIKSRLKQAVLDAQTLERMVNDYETPNA